jgi:hypothetical protein
MIKKKLVITYDKPSNYLSCFFGVIDPGLFPLPQSQCQGLDLA